MTRGTGPAAQSRNRPHFGMIPARIAMLRLPGRVHAVLLVIAYHAKGGWTLPLKLDTIANEVGIDRSKVCLCIRTLEKKGVLEVVRGGGRGLANTYRVIPDAEAAAPRKTAQPTANGVAPKAPKTLRIEVRTETVPLSVPFPIQTRTVPFSEAFGSQNSAVFGTPTERKKKKRTPPAEEARARGEDSSNDRIDEKQNELLLPIKSGRERRLRALKGYNPSSATIQFADELRVNARDPYVLGKFIDWHIAHNNLPDNIEAIDAAYRNWIRDEARFAAGHDTGGSPKRSSRSRMVDSALNRARAYDG